MKLQQIVPVLATLAASVSANQCNAKNENRLAFCPTGNAFCSSLLGYTAGSANPTLTLYQTTKATTLTTSTAARGGPTSYSTVTVYIATYTTSTTITTSVPTRTVTR